MSDDDRADTILTYVDSAARLMQMALGAQRVGDIAPVMTKIAEFAAHTRAFALDDDVEIAGTFRP